MTLHPRSFILNFAFGPTWCSSSVQLAVFAESSASIGLGIHVLSPGSNVLFTRAIMESGVPTATWTYVMPDELNRR